MVAACTTFEGAAGLPEGTLGFEIQVETPPIVLAADGRAEIAAALHAGGGRVTGLHYGTYDYSASLEVAAEQQSMAHPAADHAKLVMQAAAAETGVQLSDGSTNVLPVGGRRPGPARLAAAPRPRTPQPRARLLPGLGPAPRPAADPLPGHVRVLRRAASTAPRPGCGPTCSATRAASSTSRPPRVRSPATWSAGVTCGAVGEDELLGATGLDAAALARLAQPKSDTEGLRAPITPTAEEHQP